MGLDEAKDDKFEVNFDLSEDPANPVDPVCGLVVAEESLELSTYYRGKRYYFCCDEHKATFDESPDMYASQEDPFEKE